MASGQNRNPLFLRAETDPQWEGMTYEEKQAWLFRQQKDTLDRFLEHGAIAREQHDRSLRDLTEKMGCRAQYCGASGA